MKRIFVIAFALGAAPIFLAFLFPKSPAWPIFAGASAPGVVLVWPFTLSVARLFGDGWAALSFLAAVNGTIYGTVAVGLARIVRCLRSSSN